MTAMDRWIEAAEADRFCLIAQQRRDRPTEQTPVSAPLLTRLRSMVLPEVFHQRIHGAVTRSAISA